MKRGEEKPEMSTRNELKDLLDNNKIHVSTKETTKNTDLFYIMNHLQDHTPFERPDAYLIHQDVAYCIEVFQISQYSHAIKGKYAGDMGRMADAKKENRHRLKQDEEFNLDPNLQNLLASLKDSLETHMKSSQQYKDRVIAKINKTVELAEPAETIKTTKMTEITFKTNVSDCRIIVLLDDASEQAAYIAKFDTTPRNPLLFDDIANAIIEYQNDIWGVIYIGGNRLSKSIEGFTMVELIEMKAADKLLPMSQFGTMYSVEERKISKSNHEDDRTSVVVKLYDTLGFRE